MVSLFLVFIAFTESLYDYYLFHMTAYNINIVKQHFNHNPKVVFNTILKVIWIYVFINVLTSNFSHANVSLNHSVLYH